VILVDSSVWISYFRNENTDATAALDRLLGHEELAIGDLILAEVLQGFSTERDAARANEFLEPFELVELGGREVAVDAARNYRALRGLGVTVRKTIDTLIATACIRGGHTLVHNDRDFDAFEQHLGLRVLRVLR
jgi:predicted nucleic acid-binding protein